MRLAHTGQPRVSWNHWHACSRGGSGAGTQEDQLLFIFVTRIWVDIQVLLLVWFARITTRINPYTWKLETLHPKLETNSITKPFQQSVLRFTAVVVYGWVCFGFLVLSFGFYFSCYYGLGRYATFG